MARNCGQTQRKGSKSEVRKENYKKKSNYDRKLRTYLNTNLDNIETEVKLFRQR